MGLTQSSSSEPPVAYFNVPKINDSLYELYSSAKMQPNMEILFFHGLQRTKYNNEYLRTWISRTENGDVLWPREWLSLKFPGARMSSVSYDSCAFMTPTSGRQDLFSIGEGLVGDIVHLGKLGQDNRPVVLVGHSLGGLVIKQVILEAYKQLNSTQDNTSRRLLQNFLKNIKGIFYFSTPRHGSQLCELATGMPSCWKGLSELMMKISGTDTERLNESFRMWRKNRNEEVKAFSIRETWETASLQRGSFKRQSSFIVPELSARYDTDGYLAVLADHFTVSQPESPHDNRFEALVRFISVVTRVPVSTFEMDPDMIVIGLPVEKPGGFSNRRNRYYTSVPDEVTGIPVKTHEMDEGKGPYVRIGVLEDPDIFFKSFAGNSQDDVVDNYAQNAS